MWLERRMGARLLAVASWVRGEVVADVGSDHGLLPAWLAQRGHRVIVVEKNEGPYRRCRQALARVDADVRRGDGLAPLACGEVDCLVMSGFGARAMREILTRHPERWPPRIVAQPNHSPEILSSLGFDLVEWVGRYPILCWSA